MFRKKTVTAEKPPSINNNEENNNNHNDSLSWWNSAKIFEWLPAELFYDILSYLEASDVARMSCVCKSWKTMMADCYVWKIMCERQGWKVNPAALDTGYKYLREMCKEGTRIQQNWTSQPIRTVVQTVPYKQRGRETGYTSVCFDDQYFFYSYGTTVGLSDCWDGVPFAPATSHKTEISSICKLRDSKLLFSSSADGCIKWWKVKSKCEKITSFNSQLPKSPLNQMLEASSEGPVTSIACDHLDELLVSSTDHYIMLWDIETGKLKRTIECASSPVNQVRVNYKQILVCQQDGTCSLWDRHSKLCIQTFFDTEGRGDSMVCCQFDAHPATTVVAGSVTGVLSEWDTRNFHQRKLQRSNSKISCIDFTTNAIVFGCGTELFVEQRKTGRVFREERHSSEIVSLCCDQSRIVTCGKKADVVRVWDFNYSHGTCEWCKDRTIIFEESNFLPWRTFGRPKPSPVYCLVCRTVKGTAEFSKRKNRNKLKAHSTVNSTEPTNINEKEKDDKCLIS